MRVLVCGGRDYEDRARVWSVLNELHSRQKITTVITGGAKGADTFARGWAVGTPGVTSLVFPAKWAEQGRGAGPRRNQQMLDEGKPQIVVAFPGGVGTADMVSRARKAGVKIIKIGDRNGSQGQVPSEHGEHPEGGLGSGVRGEDV